MILLFLFFLSNYDISSSNQHYDHLILYVYDANSFRSIKQIERRLLLFKEFTKFLFGCNARSAKYDPRQSELLQAMFDVWLEGSSSVANEVEVEFASSR